VNTTKALSALTEAERDGYLNVRKGSFAIADKWNARCWERGRVCLTIFRGGALAELVIDVSPVDRTFSSDEIRVLTGFAPRFSVDDPSMLRLLRVPLHDAERIAKQVLAILSGLPETA
jgi:hypothetical protein